MSVFKSLCFSLFIGIFLSCNISVAQECDSALTLREKANQYYLQKDYKTAMQWYLKAADRGDAISMRVIAFFYSGGFGFEKDLHKAMKWFMDAAYKGDIESMNTIGYFYEEGIVLKKDAQQSKFWYKEAEKELKLRKIQ